MTGKEKNLVPDPEYRGPNYEWFCGCRESYGNVLRSASMNVCPTCSVSAPWLTWTHGATLRTARKERGDDVLHRPGCLVLVGPCPCPRRDGKPRA